MIKIGTKKEIKALLKAHTEPFYVYLLYRPDKRPFYVGKGKGDRVFQHEKEVKYTQNGNPYKVNTIRKIHASGGEVGYGIDSFFEIEKEALARECELICQIGRENLTNLTDGGEGIVNLDPRSKQKHADTLWQGNDDSPSGILNRNFQKFTQVKSVPIKPLKGFKVVPLTPHPRRKKYSQREVAALYISMMFNGVLLEKGALIPRQLVIEGIPAVIENGVGRDILGAKLATIVSNTNPADEFFQLTESGYSALKEYIQNKPPIEE